MKSLAVIALLAGTATASPTARQVLANVQHTYTRAKQLTAKFKQTVTNQTFNTNQGSAGTLYVVAPDKLRWDYLEHKQAGVAVDKSFIVDGTTLWMVDHGGKQFAKRTAQATVVPAALSFLTGTGTLMSDFTVSIASTHPKAATGAVVVSLVPTQPSAQYKQLFFVVATNDWHVRESIVVAPNGDVNDLELFQPDLKTPIRTTSFEVNPATLASYKFIP